MVILRSITLLATLAAAVTAQPTTPQTNQKRQDAANGTGNVLFRSDLKFGEGQSPQFKNRFRKLPSLPLLSPLKNPRKQKPKRLTFPPAPGKKSPSSPTTPPPAASTSTGSTKKKPSSSMKPQKAKSNPKASPSTPPTPPST